MKNQNFATFLFQITISDYHWYIWSETFQNC